MSSRVVGYVWWCGDEVCNCTQPIIERVSPNYAFRGAVKRERLWDGTFYSGADVEEDQKQLEELSEAAPRFAARILKAGETAGVWDDELGGGQ